MGECSYHWMFHGRSLVTYARQSLVSLQQTPYYHVIARCVRRAWLWGFDEYAGKDYSHRKTWVLERLAHLSSVFAIDLCAYAVMSNHYHLVVHVDQTRARGWSQEEVVERWGRIFGMPEVVERWQQGVADEAEREAAEQLIKIWRARLCDLSWYLRCLNEWLARRANAEDECKGRFWEGRFKSQALLDEAGLLTAMTYVDLNPIRAGISATPEDSDFTSIYARMQAIKHRAVHVQPNLTELDSSPKPPLLDFQDSPRSTRPALPFRFDDYLVLVDWSGRAIRPDKRGSIDVRLPAILQRLNIDPEAWQVVMRPSGNVFGRAIGRLDHLRLHAKALGQAWVCGLRQAKRLYSG